MAAITFVQNKGSHPRTRELASLEPSVFPALTMWRLIQINRVDFRINSVPPSFFRLQLQSLKFVRRKIKREIRYTMKSR